MKQEDNKVKEGQMWNRLAELNDEFKKIKQSKKISRRCLQQFYKYCSKFLFFSIL